MFCRIVDKPLPLNDFRWDRTILLTVSQECVSHTVRWVRTYSKINWLLRVMETLFNPQAVWSHQGIQENLTFRDFPPMKLHPYAPIGSYKKPFEGHRFRSLQKLEARDVIHSVGCWQKFSSSASCQSAVTMWLAVKHWQSWCLWSEWQLRRWGEVEGGVQDCERWK